MYLPSGLRAGWATLWILLLKGISCTLPHLPCLSLVALKILRSTVWSPLVFISLLMKLLRVKYIVLPSLVKAAVDSLNLVLIPFNLAFLEACKLSVLAS